MNKFKISNLSKKISVNGNFNDTCTVSLSLISLNAIEEGKLTIKINQYGKRLVIANFNLSISSISGTIIVFVAADNSQVFLGSNTSGYYDIRLWRKSKVKIGDNTTSNGIRIVCDNSEFICGKDCMFSDSILIQSADQHGIVDINKGKIVNNIFKSVILGDHVWLGRQSIITGDINIGEGSLIGTGATVTTNIPAKVIAVGIPARVIKENYTWCRSPISLDDFSINYIKKNI